jgi:MFS family permease
MRGAVRVLTGGPGLLVWRNDIKARTSVIMNAPGRPPAISPNSLTHRERMLIVAGALLPVFMGSMDQTVVSSVLPTIGREFGGANHLSWVATANLLTATAMTPLYGKISDIVGRRTTLLWAITIFMLGSLISATAPNLPMLILGRAAQGLGTGGLTSVGMTVLGDIAPPKDRARYYTYYSIVYITSGALGPVWGGFAAERLGYSTIFWANIPLGFLALGLTATLLKRLPRYERPHRLDILGACLIASASSSWIFMLNAGGHDFAWSSPQILGLAAASAVFLTGFVLRLLTAPEPLIPLGVLRNPIVLCATVANGVGWASIIGLNIYLPLYLQAVNGFSPSASGLALMVFMATVNGGALIGAQIAGRVTHYKYPAMASILVCCAACLWLAWHARAVSTVEFQIVLIVIGLGFGPVAPVSTVAMQNAVELHQLGVSMGTMSFVRSLIATGIVAAFGVIILGDAGSGRDAIFADPVRAADNFSIVFTTTAVTFFVAFLALAFMEERPLLSERKMN